MPVFLTSLSEMITMPIAVNTEEYIDVWCNTTTDAAWKIRVGDVIAVKWNADENDREYTLVRRYLICNLPLMHRPRSTIGRLFSLAAGTLPTMLGASYRYPGRISVAISIA